MRWAEYTAMIPAYYDYVSLSAAGRYTITRPRSSNEPGVLIFQWGLQHDA